ncbi:hypothetical protein HNY73_006980 [Argiope bruennichi]|uniref:Uncharacterized protein n=1 Tax=Argiope bruennichi TaxID=94029 RepID=A0A8T0FFK1_ARGBR|nr:hypothetical protein HNY73_006980 [Argiope bruennichi]
MAYLFEKRSMILTILDHVPDVTIRDNMVTEFKTYWHHVPDSKHLLIMFLIYLLTRFPNSPVERTDISEEIHHTKQD